MLQDVYQIKKIKNEQPQLLHLTSNADSNANNNKTNTKTINTNDDVNQVACTENAELKKKAFCVVETNRNKDKYVIFINKYFLDTELIMHGQVSHQLAKIQGLHQLDAIKSMIISFRKDGSNLILFDITNNDSSQKFIFNKLPILYEKKSWIAFDIDHLSNIFLSYEHALQSQDQYYFIFKDRELNYLENVNAESDSLIINQVAQVTNKISQPVKQRNVSLIQEIKIKNSLKIQYQIKPYIKNMQFKPTLLSSMTSSDATFNTSVVKSSDGSQLGPFVSKIDVNKNFTFYISDNTPERFREAIRAGILHWNRYLCPSSLIS